MGNRCGGNGKDNKYKNLGNNKLTNMLDFIFFCLIILITVVEAVGIWACAGGMDGYIFPCVLSTDGTEVLPLIPEQIF